MRLVTRIILPIVIAAALVAGVTSALGQARASVVVSAGPALAIGPMVTIENQARSEEGGNFYLTSVSIDPNVDLVEWLGARLGLEGELQPNERIRPRGISPAQYSQFSRRLLDESTTTAKVVALRRAGYTASIRNRGAVVTAVTRGRPADGVLRSGDVITAVDGRPTTTSAQVVEAVRQRAIGAPVVFTLQRDGTAMEVTVGTSESSLTPGQPTVGVSIGTDVVADLPFDIEIDAGNLGGPSAGLMFTLSILDALSPDDLTHGHRIAGTGTIDDEEQVGPIDGVKYKVRGAENAGARYFLVPRANAAEARAAARSVQVVEVNTVQEALDFLGSLPPAA
jgi:PDZ domain-containing protein